MRGLDAVSKLAIRGFVRELNREHQVTVLLTHHMDDIEALSGRVNAPARGRTSFQERRMAYGAS